MSEQFRAKLLSLIQKDFPLTPKPFERLASMLSCSEDKVLKTIKEQKDASIIRQISPIFDTKRLGYKSTLVAFSVKKDDIDRAIKIINSHPGVSHNYERDHDFNIWFTIAVAPDSKIGLENTINIMAKKAKALDAIILPTLKMFKIAVKLNTTGKDAKKEKIQKRVFKDIKLTPFYLNIIQHSQYDLPIVHEPFLDLIKRVDISYEKLFSTFLELKDAGIMKRFAGILNHRKAGFNANAMVVWDIDEEKADEIGKKAAEFSAVSHCYLRPKYKNWRYNLFTMIHGKTADETNKIIDEISHEIEYNDKRSLYSLREFKKVRIKYFSPEFKIWEENILGDRL